MRIAVVGAGAMGSLFGGLLAADHEVLLVDPWREHVDRINQAGLEIEREGRSRLVTVRAVTDAAEAGPVDLILICVKSYHSEAAAETARRLLGPDTLALSLQNGLGNGEIIAAAVGARRTVVGVTAHGATVLGPGRISHRGSGDTAFGPLEGLPTPGIHAVAAAFNRAGIAATVTDRPLAAVWGKLLVNVGINALAAITRLRNGDLLEHEGTLRLMEAAVEEAAAVAAAKKIDIPYPNPAAHCQAVARATGGNIASMLQDVLNRRRTEIEFINGAVVREGRAAGVDTPVNATLTALVRTIEASYDRRVDESA